MARASAKTGVSLYEKLRRQVPADARGMLCALAAGGDHAGVIRHKLVAHHAQQVGVDRAAHALVGGHQDQRPVLTAARLHEGMIKIARVAYHLAQHAVHQLRIRPAGRRCLLGAPHLRLRHLLHGAGDLCGFLDGNDPPPDVAGAGHLKLLIRRLVLVEGCLEVGLDLVVHLANRCDFLQQSRPCDPAGKS